MVQGLLEKLITSRLLTKIHYFLRNLKVAHPLLRKPATVLYLKQCESVPLFRTYSCVIKFSAVLPPTPGAFM
jgi:hypothetical protein